MRSVRHGLRHCLCRALLVFTVCGPPTKAMFYAYGAAVRMKDPERRAEILKGSAGKSVGSRRVQRPGINNQCFQRVKVVHCRVQAPPSAVRKLVGVGCRVVVRHDGLRGDLKAARVFQTVHYGLDGLRDFPMPLGLCHLFGNPELLAHRTVMFNAAHKGAVESPPGDYRGLGSQAMPSPSRSSLDSYPGSPFLMLYTPSL